MLGVDSKTAPPLSFPGLNLRFKYFLPTSFFVFVVGVVVVQRVSKGDIEGLLFLWQLADSPAPQCSWS